MPRKQQQQRPDRSHSIRFTDEEWQSIISAATAAKLSAHAWVRTVVLTAEITHRRRFCSYCGAVWTLGRISCIRCKRFA